MNTQQSSWLMSLGAKPIPEVWHSEKNRGFVKKTNQEESVRFGQKQIKLSQDAKNKLMSDIHEVMKLGILDVMTIYDKLLIDGKLTQSDGRIIPVFSLHKYVYAVRNELNIKIKSRTQMIVELFKNGVTDRNELAGKVGCTEDHVSKVLRENGLKKKRTYKIKGVINGIR